MSSRKIALNGIKSNIDTSSFASQSNFLTLKQSYVISASRGEGEKHEVEIDEDDNIEFIFDDGTVWFGNANTLHELFPDIDLGKRSADDMSELPLTLSAEGDSRSLKSVALKVFNIFAKKAVKQGVIELASYLEKKLLDDQSGLYQIDPSFELSAYKSTKTDSPILLFLHGTGSSTKGSFSELNGSELWNEMKKVYSKNILAFQHETFTKSPLKNVLELLTQLPDNSVLHLISHSRGGLVGEVLARFCFDENGFNEAGIELLKRIERTDDIDCIASIKDIITKKKIKIERFIRVACPARGTSILSDRLDFFFNVSMNLVSLAGGVLASPVVDGFKALISAVLDSKNDVRVLPGLEAMCPSSPFLKVLNAPDVISGNLAVISGNATYSISLKALVVIVSKLVFQDDNDFVVNTVSMYQGARRSKPIQYFFDEGAEVNHFSYFKNDKTRKAILTALTSKDEALVSFMEYTQAGIDESQRGIFGLEGGVVFYDKVTGSKPIAIVLPGIMGSNLSKEGAGVWINYLKLISGGLTELDPAKPGIRASSLIKTSYKDLCTYLSDEYDVVTFPFDWRLSVSESAKYLNDKIKFLLSYDQPIKIIAHSMGGVLVKEFILNFDATWKQLNGSAGFKLLMLGTPWLGSYRIPNVFAGRDGIIKQLSTLDFAHTKEELISLFSKFPGILNLLPVVPDRDFSKPEVWVELQKASQLVWNIPSKAILADFAKFRKNTLDNADKIDFTNVRYVAGKDTITQIGYEVVKGELQFKVTGKGDQSVSWELGIPAKLKNSTSLYYSNTTHGALACDEKLFPAIKQLIQKGSTDLLSRVEPVVNDNVSRSLSQTKAEEIFETDEVSAVHKLLGLPMESTKKKATLPAMKVNVSNGDLMFSSYPVVLGHFKGDGIVSAERVADNYLRGELSIKHALGNYPGDIGSHQLLITRDEEFHGACVVGLGEVDKLSAQGLVSTIEKAIIQYLLDYCKKDQNTRSQMNGISVLLIGTDYGGLSVDSSVRSILLGIQSANAKIQVIKQGQVNLIEEVEFVELFEDRALRCFYALKKIMSSTSDELQIEFKNTKIKKLLGSRKRLLMESKSDWWQRLTVLSENDAVNANIKHLSYYTATNGAREEEKDLRINMSLIEDLLETISTDEHWTPQIAKTIFELLIPNEFKENIKRQTDILWVLDKHSASYPWELFQTDVEKSKPLCINAGMIRQLATTEYRANVTPVNNKNVLIIGDPLTLGFCNQLPGAEKEANAITKLFGMFDYDIESLIKKSSSDIVTALFRQDYKIIHVSGHGNFDKNDPEKSGMIIGNNIFLTPREFNQLSYTPELVFVNCCYLGKVDSEQESLYASRYKFAANIGTQLIQNGVKVVIAAGWAVDDAAALEFANVFYQRMFDGYEFGKAVLEARKVIYDKYPYTNTWGAFQCYGDPFYKLKITGRRISRARNYIIPQEAENDVENLISKAQIEQGDPGVLHQDLDAILDAIMEFKVETPDLLEKVALAYVEVDDYKKAIELFSKVLQSEKATYSVSSLEKYNNILAKQVLIDYLNGKDLKRNYKQEIVTVILSLTKLLEIAETSERHSLIGSAYKRKAAICNLKTEKIKALTQAAYHYYKAHERDQEGSTYSLVNWIEIEFFLQKLGVHKWGGKAKEFDYQLPTLVHVKKELEKSIGQLNYKIENESYDYWDLVSNANAALCLWFLSGSVKDDDEHPLSAAYTETWEFVGSRNKKMSEIEHFILLIDFSRMFKTKNVSNVLSKLKNELEKSLK